MRPLTSWLTVLVAVLVAGVAAATTIHVPGDQPTIQAGIDAAAYGDTVLVASGYYVENIAMKDGVALLGSDAGTPTIDSATGYSVVRCIGVFSTDTRIEGFHLTGGTAGGWSSGVICDEQSSARIRHNLIRGNIMGVLLKENEGHAVVEHNTIVGNSDCGIQLYNGDVQVPSGTALISSNIIAGNTNYGIYRGSGTGWDLPLHPDVDCNDVWGNGQNYREISPGGHDISEDPLFCDPDIGNFMIDEMSPCAAANNSCGVLMGAYGVGCGASVVQSTSWGAIKAMYR